MGASKRPSPVAIFLGIGAMFALSALLVFQGIHGVRAGEIRVPNKGETRYVKESQAPDAFWSAVYTHFGMAALASGLASWWGIRTVREQRRSRA